MDHTPGPWRVLYGLGQAYGISREEAPTYPIAFMSMREDNNIAANAVLLAAAPELLQALIQAVTEAGWLLSGPTDMHAAENGEPAWVCKARAVIAKATRHHPIVPENN